MTDYVMLYRHNRGNDWKIKEGTANTLQEFLNSINDDILRKREFVVYTVLEEFDKDQLISDGHYDHVIPEDE